MKAIICEGGAEQAIAELLLFNDMLCLKTDELLENKVIRERNATRFCEKYLGKKFDDTITIYRILDSRRENFKLTGLYKKLYEDKISVVNVVTSPEIEILYIIGEAKHREYQKSRKKPSEFCKQDLRCTDVKSYDFVYEYFSNTDKLREVLREYNRVYKKKTKGELFLFDLLKEEYKN